MTTTFSVTRDQCIVEALGICGVYDITNGPVTADYNSVAFTFNMMIKSWVMEGIPIWKIINVAVPLLSGQNTYNVGPYATGTGAVVTDRIDRTIFAFMRDANNNDIPLQSLSFQEYNQYGAKQSPGIANSYMYVARADSAAPAVSSYVTLYPTPQDSTHTLYMVAQVTLNDVNVGTDPVDFPQEMYLGLTWCLADLISMKYAASMDRVQFIASRAAQMREKMLDWCQENTDSIRLQYDTRSR